MSTKIIVLGAGVSGHTAALFAKKLMGNEAEVHVISPLPYYNWIPSNIWVGVGQMSEDQVKFPLAPVYLKEGIIFHQGKAIGLRPEGSEEFSSPHVIWESTDSNSPGIFNHGYDYLINATGPKLNFAATKGLGPSGFSLSVCTPDHALHAADHLNSAILAMKKGERRRLVIGTGHGSCTCEGAAFEYVFNVDFELRRQGVRDLAEIIFLTNEATLGDFGVNGLQIKMGGYTTSSKIFAESLYAERNIKYILGAHVREVQKNQLEYENLAGEVHFLDFDFAMLLPPFQGHMLETFNRKKEDITSQLFNPGGFMKVDGDYRPKEVADWAPEDWPKYYTNNLYKNIFAVGIAFAPPHQISIPRKNSLGTNITPAPPRTGMPSATMGRVVAENIVKIIHGRVSEIKTASMADLSAACIASTGSSLLTGSAVSMTMSPIVPNYTKYPESGRDLSATFGEIGLAGHWIKRLLHSLFIYKAKAKLFWWIIPE